MNKLISIWDLDYAPTGKHNFAIMAALMLVAGIVNTAGGRALKIASLVSVFIHIVGTIVIVVMVLAGAPKLQSPKFVFTEFRDYTGYTESGAAPVLVFLLGLLQSQWSMLGYDA